MTMLSETRRIRRLRWYFSDLGPDWVTLTWVGDFGQKAMCLLAGHEPIPDQCAMPEHDYCAYCQKSMPGEGIGRKSPP